LDDGQRIAASVATDPDKGSQILFYKKVTGGDYEFQGDISSTVYKADWRKQSLLPLATSPLLTSRENPLSAFLSLVFDSYRISF
jgi:hypothetical protein